MKWVELIILFCVDANGDGVITEDEFTALPPGEVEGEEFQAMDRNWQKERREEFRKSMDLDHDGKVVKDELKVRRNVSQIISCILAVFGVYCVFWGFG